MKKILENSIVFVGFLCGIVLYLWITITIDRHGQTLCFDCQMPTGFPFAYYQDSGFVEPPRYLWFGLIADALLGIVFCFGIGFIFKFVWSKISSSRVKLK